MKQLFLIFTSALIALSSCQQHTNPDQLINNKASLPDSFKLSERNQKVITSFINKKDSTTSILYGTGTSRTLVTWRQQDDPHWFGARIPGDLISVETLEIGKNKPDLPNYEKYIGKTLVKLADTNGRQERIYFILAQKPSITP